MKLYYHPLSTFSQKVSIALLEKRAAYTPVLVHPGEPAGRAELAKLTPLGKIPVLVLDDGRKIPESTIIIEYLDSHIAGGTRLIPEDRDLARQTRFHDRLADLYVTEPRGKLYFDAKKPAAERDPAGVAAARQRLDTMYAGLDEHLAQRTWVMGDAFTMADCSLAPALGYLRRLHPFEHHAHLTAYAHRLFERPSVARVLEEAAPFLAKAAAA